jgi:hypothetical protein
MRTNVKDKSALITKPFQNRQSMAPKPIENVGASTICPGRKPAVLERWSIVNNDAAHHSMTPSLQPTQVFQPQDF